MVARDSVFRVGGGFGGFKTACQIVSGSGKRLFSLSPFLKMQIRYLAAFRKAFETHQTHLLLGGLFHTVKGFPPGLPDTHHVNVAGGAVLELHVDEGR